MIGRRAAAAITTVVGIVIAIAGFGFVITRVADNWTEVRHGIDNASRGWLVPAVLFGVIGMALIAAAWRTVVSALGAEVSTRDVVRWYFPGELGKYVPGGIWPVVGRAELAYRGGVRRAVAYASVALSLGALYLSAIAVVTVTLPAVLAAKHNSSAPLFVVLLLPLGIGALHPRVLTGLRDVASRVAKREIAFVVPPWRTSLMLVARYVPAWLFIGGSTWCVARAFEHQAPLGQVFVAAVASWVAGFVLVPVPGGVGVREAAFVAMAGLPVGIGATVALVARVMFMAIDAGGAVVAPVAARESVGATNAPEP